MKFEELKDGMLVYSQKGHHDRIFYIKKKTAKQVRYIVFNLYDKAIHSELELGRIWNLTFSSSQPMDTLGKYRILELLFNPKSYLTKAAQRDIYGVR